MARLLYYSVAWLDFEMSPLSVPMQETWSMTILYFFQLYFQVYLLIILRMLTIGFCYDLMRTIKNPISKLEKRAKRIYIWTGVACVVFTIYMPLSMYVVNIYTDSELFHYGISKEEHLLAELFLLLIFLVQTIYELRALHTAVFGIFMRKGLNMEIKVDFLKKSVLFVVIRVMCGVPNWIQIYAFLSGTAMDGVVLYSRYLSLGRGLLYFAYAMLDSNFRAKLRLIFLCIHPR